MSVAKASSTSKQSTFLGRLRQDSGGNVLSIMAVFMFPMMVLVGSAVDISRTFVVKTRLQQACDTAILVGRKYMTATSGTNLDLSGTSARDRAQSFFASNFNAGWMGSSASTLSFTPVRTSDGQAKGTAQVTIPMTIMRLFGSTVATTTVECVARYDIADSDVMFVLDTTGSMADPPTGSCTGGGVTVTYTRTDGTTGYRETECNNSRIAALRTAVMIFYDTLAAAQGLQTEIRYGFVPYSSAANVGYLLPSSHIVDSWTYPSREPIPGAAGDENIVTSTGGSTAYNQPTIPGISSSTCTSYAARVPVTGFTDNGTADVRTVQSWTSTGGGLGNCVIRVQPVKPKWRYKNVTHNTSQFKLGNVVDDPTKIPAAATSRWQGCVEERQTTASSSFTPSSLPADLDPDLAATSDATRWKPMWPEVVYYRGNTTSIDFSGGSVGPYGDSTSTADAGQYTNLVSPFNLDSFYVACGHPAQRLAEMTRDQMLTYLYGQASTTSTASNSFVPYGTTYHDVGMIWGTRLISPTGLFSADTATHPGHANPPNRYIIFMTDGQMYNRGEDYGLYGIENYDKRVQGSLSTGLETLHATRFNAVCTAAKDRGIVVYVIAFGTSLSTSMSNCASPGSAYAATTTSGLGDIFQQIAGDIAQLRLTQ